MWMDWIGAPTPSPGNDMRHLRHGPSVEMRCSTCDTARRSTARSFPVPAIQPVDRQRTHTARRAVTELMYPGNGRVGPLC